jgi:hypothetical protein
MMRIATSISARLLCGLSRTPPITASGKLSSPKRAARATATSRWKTISSTSLIGDPRIGAFAAGDDLHLASD